MKKFICLFALTLPLFAEETEPAGPGPWESVHTNSIAAWQKKQKPSSAKKVWNGVVADLSRKEVRILAEACGHKPGITAEFALVGPLSDRAYEAAAVSVANPSDICRAVEALGIKRGAGNGSERFLFWARGEHFSPYYRVLSEDGEEKPLAELFEDKEPEEPMLGKEGIVYTGGLWEGEHSLCDTEMPSSIISLYNTGKSIFDIPFQLDQSSVYGRLSLEKEFPKGELLEIILRPQYINGKHRRLRRFALSLHPRDGEIGTMLCDEQGESLDGTTTLQESLDYLRDFSAKGYDTFVSINFSWQLTIEQATAAAKVFDMLDGKGIKIDSTPEDGIYYRAFLPLAKWRKREDRLPQPFELHVSRTSDGELAKSLTFIEEDWSGEGLDPVLTPKEYPFENWSELLPLVQKTGGAKSKVRTLFLYSLPTETLETFRPALECLRERLPLVYFWTE